MFELPGLSFISRTFLCPRARSRPILYLGLLFGCGGGYFVLISWRAIDVTFAAVKHQGGVYKVQKLKG